ncbi:trigger factor [Azotosporobacter soli]|uniref:trigger factor n=1 Tax=Azotosporobacter soli TaxID=3055040 RepID=UPI0031FE637F
MKATMEKIDNHTVVFEVEVPAAELTKGMERAYQSLASKVNIPGFRKGKVPRNVLEKRIGKEAILDEAFELVATPAYNKALDEHKVEPVSRPSIEVVTLEADKDVVFKAKVTVKPEVQLGQYKGLTVSKTVEAVDEAEITKQIDALRERQSKLVVVEGATLADGDFAIIDFEGFVDGVAFPGGEGKGYPLQIGSNTFIPGFEEQLIGSKAGEAKEVKVTFPAEYHSEELAGKEAMFKVTVQDVKRKELPVLDDEFVKEASEFNTVEEMKEDLRSKMEAAAVEKADKDFKNEAIKQAVDNATTDIPAVMVDARVDSMMEDLKSNLESRGMKLEHYLQFMSSSLEDLKGKYRESAEVNVKTDLTLDAIAKAEALEAGEADIKEELEEISKHYGASVEQVQKVFLAQGRMGMLLESILRRKAANLIIESVAQA